MVRSVSLKTRIDILKTGTMLFKIRDKGMRGINVYKRYIFVYNNNITIHNFIKNTDKTTKYIPGNLNLTWTI